jgi:predicted alpha/beta superfamily hydrolase
MKTLFAFVLCGSILFSFGCNPHRSGPADNKITIGTIDNLHSQILDEDRKIWVYVPESNKIFAEQKYPVVYLLDGEGHFYSVMGLIQQLSQVNGNMVLPGMIVVGIANTDRTRDLTPSHVSSDPTISDTNFLKTSGGGEKFMSFLEKELIPYIDSMYPTAPYRTLVGHSFGGLTVINSLTNHTRLFNSYISIDPSMWWDNRKLLNQAKTVLAEKDFSGTALYLGVANTMAGDMDTFKVRTDTSGTTRHIRAILELNEYLNENHQNNLKYRWKFYGEDDHGSVPLISEYDGFRFIFDFYKPDFDFNRIVKPDFNIDSLLDVYSEVLSRNFGYKTSPPEPFINQLGYALMELKQYDRAHKLFLRNIENYPTSSNVYDSFGELLLKKGDTLHAIQNYEKSLKLNPQNENARVLIGKMKKKYKGRQTLSQ